MDTIPERLDWLWFLVPTLRMNLPNHSVLSKARARWRVADFKELFDRIVWQFRESGLIDGSRIFLIAVMHF
jgi:hypothetical protein